VAAGAERGGVMATPEGTGDGNVAPIKFSAPFTDGAEAAAAAEVIASGWLVGGPRLKELEERFASHCGRRHAIGVSSWTTGAFLVLHAWGVGRDDEVVVPSLSFIATANVAVHVGATPVFADIETATYNMDSSDVERRITPRTRVLMPVDQVGMPCDMDALMAVARRHGIKVLQDAACAIGSIYRGRPVGAHGDATIFSLHARKLVTTGEGGMIVTDDDALAAHLRILRHQGMSISDDTRHASRPTVIESYPEVGFNFRMTDVQAAIGNAQMTKLPAMVKRRRILAERYRSGLQRIGWLSAPAEPAGCESNWQSYMVRLLPDAPIRRNALMDRLYDRGVPTRRGIMASHLEPPYRARAASLPVTEGVSASTLLLPMHNALSDEQQDFILQCLASVDA